MKVFLVLVTLSLTTLEIATQDLTSTAAPIAAALKRIPSRHKSLKRFSGFSPHHPRIINQKPPFNVLQNGPYYINHYIHCDNLDQQTLDQIKSGSFSPSEKIQLIKDKYPSFSSDSSLDNYKIGSYTGNKEIHILHLPKGEPHDSEDINLHLALADAHKFPEIDLDLNKHFGSFEVNLPSIKPPKAEISLLPNPSLTYNELGHPPVKSYADIVKPLIDGISKIPQTYTNINNVAPNLGSNIKDESGTHNSEEEEIDIPHIENHPLENDPNKSSYNSPGAVNSYGEPIRPSKNHQISKPVYSSPTNPSFAHLTPSDIKNQGKFSYNSPGALDSYGLPATTQNLQHLTNNEILRQQAYYINQLNEIHDISRRRRQEGRNSVEARSSSEEVRHPNHRYD